MMKIIKTGLQKIFYWGNQDAKQNFSLRSIELPQPISRYQIKEPFYPSTWIGRIIEFREIGRLANTNKVFRGKITDAANRLAIVEVYKEGVVFVKDNYKSIKNNYKKEHVYFQIKNLDKKFYYLVKWSGGRWKPVSKIRPGCLFCNYWAYFQRVKDVM